MEIAPGIHRLDAPLGARVCATYLLVGSATVVLVDTGVAGTIAGGVLPYLGSIGVEMDRLRLILITHADVDHNGDTTAAKDAFPRALLACHRDDAAEIDDLETMITRRYGEFVADHGIADPPATQAWVREVGKPAPVDLLLTGGERLRLEPGWEVELLHTPGHSRGHLTVWDPRSRAAIIADAALWRTLVSPAGAPVFPPTYRYIDAYRGSIARLQALRPEWLLTSHFPTMQGDAAMAFLAESLAYTEQVESVLLARLAGGPLTTVELIQAAGSDLGPWPIDETLPALAFPVVGHLERLAAVGAIRQERNASGLVTWHIAA